MGRPLKYPSELRDRAVRMVIESKADYGSEFEAITSISRKLGITTPETLRRWVHQAEIDGGQRPGKSSEDLTDPTRRPLERLRAHRTTDPGLGRLVQQREDA